MFHWLRLTPLLLAACTLGPDYQRPGSTVSEQFKELKGWAQAQPRDHELSGQWWELFADPYLNGLERQVTVANQTIAQAEAQYRQAQSLVRTARAAYFPTLNATATANRFRAAGGQNLVVSGVRNLFGGALSVAWEPDLWGRVHRQVEASTSTAQANAATLQALKLSTQAAVAQNYFQLRALDAQIKLLNDTVTAYQKTLAIIQNRYNAGVVAKADVVQAQTQLESTRAQGLDLGIQRAQLEHAIALLVGKAPSQLTIAAGLPSKTVPSVPLYLPSQLLERRPDIAAAERLTAAANAQIGVARAAYFPRLNLATTDGTQANDVSNLFTTAANYWALGPAALALPLLDGGSRSAQVTAAVNNHQATVAAYRQAVLVGFQEVEDGLSALRILAQEIDVQNKAVASARQALELTINQYKAGTVSYVNVMTAQANALSNEQTAVNLQGQRLTTSVQLIKALGGGWQTAALPKAGQVDGNTSWTRFLPCQLPCKTYP